MQYGIPICQAPKQESNMQFVQANFQIGIDTRINLAECNEQKRRNSKNVFSQNINNPNKMK